MKRFSLLILPALLSFMVASTPPQAPGHFPTPPPSLDQVKNNDLDSKQTRSGPNSRRLYLVQAQREADDLARTAQTIPSDVATREGMLPKDVIEKLKQIERLSSSCEASSPLKENSFSGDPAIKNRRPEGRRRNLIF